jgi:hypothetical protein
VAEQAQEPEDERPAREQLWRRLLAGQVTEVYVTGFESRTNRYLPQTLGLEPIFSVPNRRNHGTLASVARQLAAEPRWIAGGGPWEEWDRHFAERAQVILIFDLYDIVARRENNPDFGLVYTLAHRRRVARIRREGRAFTEEDAWREFFAQTAGAAEREGLTRSEYAAYEVRERYRDKTFVIIDPDDRRRLRATRAVAANG